MSKIVKKPLIIPKNVELNFENKGNEIIVKVKGPKGTVEKKLLNIIDCKIDENKKLILNLKTTNSKMKPFLATSYRIIENMIKGVQEHYSKVLEIYGVGYKANVAGKTLKLNVGYSHEVNYNIPQNIEVKVSENKIIVSGPDKELVGLVAAQIREIKKPDPYRGKGLRYQGENPIRKVGKKAAT
ncbi:MAG: 50S ribosomal protein L6 [Spirochaetes bacterium]|nr:50S ribosomal protein L6 [Spirochaetota bacterium]